MLQSLITLDVQFSQAINLWGRTAPTFWKQLAIYGVYIVPIVLLWYWFARRRETALLAALSGLVAWLVVAKPLSSLIGRVRPVSLIDYHFPQKEFVFDRPGPSFPSDHATFLATMTVIFWLAGEKRLSIVLGTATLMTLLARVVTAQHFLGDVLVGMLLGGLVAWIIWLFRRPIERTVVQPLVRLARRMGL